MRKPIIVLSIIFLLLVCSISFDHRMGEKLPQALPAGTPLDAVSITLIGDSWTEHLREPLEGRLDSLGLKPHVEVFGYPGARTRRIYETSLHLPIRPGICVVSAGNNDFVGHQGSKFFRQQVL
jgi:hypothetical protein